MPITQSRVTAQGQISIPAAVRKRLGLGPGSVLEWDEEGDLVVVRRAGRYSSQDVHRALFSRRPRTRTVPELKQGIRRHVQKKHARR